MTDFKLLFKYPVFWCMIFYNNNNLFHVFNLKDARMVSYFKALYSLHLRQTIN